MPTPMRRRLRLARRGAWYAVAGLLVGMAVVLGVASQVLPLAERHPEKIEAWLTARAGRPVAFDHVDTEWTRRGPLLRLDGLRLGEGANAVRIGEAEVLVSMYAGLLPGRSFTELRLRGLSLTLQRADDGKWSVLGLPGQGGGGDPLKNLEGLGELQVIDGKLALLAPSLGWDLELPKIDLRLRVDGDRVRAGTRAWIDSNGTPVQVAFDFDRDSGDGRAYLDIKALDAAAWTSVLRYAGVVAESGDGRVQGWVELRKHRVVLVTSDLKLRQMGLRGAPLANGEVPRAHFDRVEGRVRWRLSGSGWRFDAPNLVVGKQENPQKLDGLVVAGGRQYALLADQIDAAPLFALMGLSDRVDPGLRQWLSQAAPSARLAKVSLVGNSAGMRAQGRLDGVGFLPVAHSPGIKGLAGEFVGDGDGFALKLDPATPFRFDWPSGFGVAHDVTLDGALAGWREGAGWRVGTSALRIRGKNFGAHARGGLWFQGDGTRPWIDIAADVDETPVPAAKGFWIHDKMSKRTVDWLNNALAGGKVRDGRAIISGDLDDWPFIRNNGRFEAVARIDGGQFKFQPEWPAMDHVDAEVAFVGNGFSIEGQGALAGVRVESFKASIPDFSKAELSINARGASDAAQMLAMLRQSPLQKKYGDTLTNLSASGPARATYDMLLPLHTRGGTERKSGGTVELLGNQLADKRWNLAFESVRGKVDYSDNGFVAEKLAVSQNGQPGALSLRAGGGVRDQRQAFEAELSASLPATELLDRAPEMAWLKPYVEGRSQWIVGVTLPAGSGADVHSQLNLRSDLVGTTLKLPAPLDKSAFLALPTTVRTAMPMGSGNIDVAFGKLLALRARGNGKQTGVRVVLGSNTVSEAAPASGLIATGRTSTMDPVEWIALARGGNSAGGSGSTGSKLSLRHIDVTADRLLLLGAAFPDTRLRVAPSANALAVTLDGQALSGSVLVPEADGAAIVGKFARLHWRDASPKTASASGNTATPNEPIDPAVIPPQKLDIDDLRFGDAYLGSAQLRTQQTAAGMRIQQLSLRSPKQKIDIQGDWLGRGAAARTQLAADIDSEDLGGLLDGLGFKGRVGGGKGKVKFDARWSGSPAAFSLPAMEGSLHIAARDGQLLEVEPGAGRVLGLLSLTQLPRRMMLDFRDFFSKGFAFNRIDGNVRFGAGVARSEDMVIDGPAAQINIRGNTDLRAQRFDQTIEVLPKSGNVLTVVGAVAGGPLGAAIGAAANAVLKKPLGELGAKTYRVTGPWKDPKVEVISRQQSRVEAPGVANVARAP